MADNVPTDAGLKPKRFSGDTGSAEQHDLDKLIEWDKYQREKELVGKKPKAFAGLGLSKCSHPTTR